MTMEQSIKNKVVVITGGARGIGFAIAEEILKESAKVVIIIDLNDENGAEAKNQLNSKYGKGKAVFIKANVFDNLEETFNVIIENYSTVDILVNNAGIPDYGDIRKVMNINAVAAMEWSKKYYDHMRKDKGGHGGTILNISSVYGYMINPIAPVYKASKFAILGYSASLGHVRNYKETGVRVVVLCPGGTDTFMLRDIPNRNYGSDVLSREKVAAYYKNSKCQTTEEVGKAAVEVIKNFVTGSVWNVTDGKITDVKLFQMEMPEGF